MVNIPMLDGLIMLNPQFSGRMHHLQIIFPLKLKTGISSKFPWGFPIAIFPQGHLPQVRLHAGNLFGERALLKNEPRAASVTAVTEAGPWSMGVPCHLGTMMEPIKKGDWMWLVPSGNLT